MVNYQFIKQTWPFLFQNKSFRKRVFRVQNPLGKSDNAGVACDFWNDGGDSAHCGFSDDFTFEQRTDYTFMNEAAACFQLAFIEEKGGLGGGARYRTANGPPPSAGRRRSFEYGLQGSLQGLRIPRGLPCPQRAVQGGESPPGC